MLRDVEMRVSAGALVYVQGDNGCGKSTLMRILARVTVPTRGHVTGLPAQVGYVPERFPPGLSFTPASTWVTWVGFGACRIVL